MAVFSEAGLFNKLFVLQYIAIFVLQYIYWEWQKTAIILQYIAIYWILKKLKIILVEQFSEL